MKHIDLFSGIGGFALAARWMGWETVQFCEKEPFAREVLNKNFPGVPISTDIFNLHLNECTERTILTGGFPCQPFSQAGERKGMADARAIWPEMLRVIHESKPTYVVAENVSGILTISDGLVFEGVCADLESEGYEVQPIVIPASGIGAYHQRARVWFVGIRADYATDTFCYNDSRKITRSTREEERISELDRKKDSTCGKSSRTNKWDSTRNEQDINDVTYANSNGRFWGCINSNVKESYKTFGSDFQCETSRSGTFRLDSTSYEYPKCERLQEQQSTPFTAGETFSTRRCDPSRIKWPSQPPVCGRADGLPSELVRNRAKQLKGYGNAIVPQVAYEIFKALTY